MAPHAAFLRGINVGNRRASGERLRSCVEALGFGEVASFRNSGNLVFSAGAGGASKLAATLETCELYWLPQGGLSQSELGMKGTDGLVGRCTVRTKGTIEQMTSKYFDA